MNKKDLIDIDENNLPDISLSEEQIKGDSAMINNINFINQLKLQNPDALLYVLDNSGNPVYKMEYSNLNSAELSEECVNEVFFKFGIH